MLIVPAPRKNSPNLIEEMRANGIPEFDENSYVPLVFNDAPQHDPRKWVVAVHPVFREHEPERDGFRFEKWGPYVGTRKLTRDYLYQCTDIEYICVWHIYQII